MNIPDLRHVLVCLIIFVFAAVACIPPFPNSAEIIILATTTSTRDSGLLDLLLPIFEEETGYFVKPIAVGSGHAIAMGTRGEADILLVHSPDAEHDFMVAGHGVERRIVMYNDFVLLGPISDPADIKGGTSVSVAFSEIASSGSLFVSRGDNSGTHALEQAIWRTAGVDPTGNRWHQETGQGMGATLNIANQKDGYTLADRGTFLATEAHLQLEIVIEGDEGLLNVYHLIPVNPVKHPAVNIDAATALSDFLTSPGTQELIRTFGVNKYGEPLFFPAADGSG